VAPTFWPFWPTVWAATVSPPATPLAPVGWGGPRASRLRPSRRIARRFVRQRKPTMLSHIQLAAAGEAAERVLQFFDEAPSDLGCRGVRVSRRSDDVILLLLGPTAVSGASQCSACQLRETSWRDLRTTYPEPSKRLWPS